MQEMNQERRQRVNEIYTQSQSLEDIWKKKKAIQKI